MLSDPGPMFAIASGVLYKVCSMIAMRFIALVTKPPGGADPSGETSDLNNDNRERGGRGSMPSVAAIARRAQKRLRTGGGGAVDRPPAPATVPPSPPGEPGSKRQAAGGDRRPAGPGRRTGRPPQSSLPTMMKLRPEAYFAPITGDGLDGSDDDDVATVDTAASSTVDSRRHEPPKPPLEVRASRPRAKFEFGRITI